MAAGLGESLLTLPFSTLDQSGRSLHREEASLALAGHLPEGQEPLGRKLLGGCERGEADWHFLFRSSFRFPLKEI